MTKKATVTKEIIAEAALEIARTEGFERINARSLAQKIGCTTQPVLYHFSSIADIKEEVYRRADLLHTEFITDIRGRYKHPMLEIGMQYIRFAAEEKNLFRLLFQSDKFASKGLDELLNGGELAPLLNVLSSAENISEEKAREVFACIFLPVHGFASLIANNAMIYDEEYIIKIITSIYVSIINKWVI